MATPRDVRIDEYIGQSAPFARPILAHLRKLVHRACPEVTEDIKWGMPHFLYRGKILCHMAAFKAHCAFGFWDPAMKPVLAADGVNSDEAMGSLGRITARDDLPPDRQLTRYLKHSARLWDAPAPKPMRAVAPQKKKKSPELPVPADLAAALKKHQAAATTFAKFSPSHRKEYIQWITEAKRDETRARRLATTLAWLAAGKARHWKYQDC